MLLILVAVGATVLAWFTYWRLEKMGTRALVPAACRAVAWFALGALLLNFSCPTRPGPMARPIVLLDGSLSMLAAGGQWPAARDSARLIGDVTLFGDARPASDSLPTFGRSALGPAIAAAAASDRRVLVISDGEIDDVAELAPEALARVGVRLFPRTPTADLAVTRFRGPDRVTAGDTLRLDVEVRAFGSASDSARVEIRQDQRVLARRALRLGAQGSGALTFAVPTAGLSGDILLTAALVAANDAEPRDDARLWLVKVSPTPGIVVIANPGDWDSRFLLRAIRDVAQLPVRGYLRMEEGRWRTMEALTPVGSDEVQQAARRADLLVLKGAAPELLRETRARGRWLWPSGEGGETVIPGEWYASAPAISPVSGAFVGLPVDSFPPLNSITPVEPATGDWIGLTAQASRRGADRPIMIGQVTGGVRRVTTAADGLWRWAFRGGSSEQAYRSLVAGSLSWLLGAADSTAGKARVVRPVVANGRPVLFEWSGAGAAMPVGITVVTAGVTARDTLRFDGNGRASLWLPVGRHTYQAEGGGAGSLAVEEWSEEWLPRPAVLENRDAPAIASTGFTSSRSWIWLFGLCVAGLAAEWFFRRKLGLR
jgi:hypothetical protein